MNDLRPASPGRTAGLIPDILRNGDADGGEVEKMSDVKAVEFEAEVRPAKQMADRTHNIVLNVPEYCIEQALEIQRHTNELVKVVIEFVQK